MPEPTPEQQKAQEQMRQWMERHNPSIPIPGPFGIPFGQIIVTVQNLVAAAGAGQFAVSPDVGEAINKQLTQVRDELEKMRVSVVEAAADPRFGGGYAKQISRFVQGVASGEAGSAAEILAKFQDEVEQLKRAITQSMGNYGTHEAHSTNQLNAAGGGS